MRSAGSSLLLALLAAGMMAGPAQAQTVYWTGGTNRQWTHSGNWTNETGAAAVPGPGTNVVIDSAAANQPLLDLAAGPVTIASLTVGSTAASTLTFTNGYAAGNKLIVAGDVTIGGFGTLTHPANSATPAHWLALTVGNNMSIQVSGSNTGRIDVAGRGYPAYTGPGGTGGNGRRGGSHGGEGGFSLGSTSVITPYDSITNPLMQGAGGGDTGTTTANGAGGGVVVLEVGGALTFDGMIVADGKQPTTWTGSGAGGGAGGSVNVRAGTLAGSGTITANGGAGNGTGSGGGGGGGRIALVLTNAGATFASFSVTNVHAYGGLPLAHQPGAAGTVYLNADGETFKETLLVDNKGGGSSYATTLFTNATYRFDAIVLTNNGVLAVGTNAVLSLTNSTLVCNSTTNAITSRIIVNTDSGGKLGWPAVWTNRGTISSKGTNSWLSGACNLTLSTNGILTHEGNKDLSGYDSLGNASYVTRYHRVALDLTGDLTLESGGAIVVTGRGCPVGVNPTGVAGNGTRPGGSHGGEGGVGTDATTRSATYGSVTNPVLPGAGGQGASGGGLILLKIDGTLTVNGSIVADGNNADNNGGGAGGGVNIRANSVAGSGTVAVRGGSSSAGGSSNGSGGGGGRIAIVLSQGAYSQFTNVKCDADGGPGQGATSPSVVTAQHGASGTIFLKGADQSYGTLIVNKSRTPITGTVAGPLSTTLFSTNVTDAVVGDVVLTNYAHLAVGTNATFTVLGNWNNVATTPGWTNIWGQGTVELAGTAAATVKGSDAWCNLVITNAGKVVSFETNKTQFVYGTPDFRNNVTLQSTSNGVWWYLLKPGSGTQDVGGVQVRDSNATNGWTFRAVGGANLGHNINWLFSAKGFIILVR